MLTIGRGRSAVGSLDYQRRGFESTCCRFETNFVRSTLPFAKTRLSFLPDAYTGAIKDPTQGAIKYDIILLKRPITYLYCGRGTKLRDAEIPADEVVFM